MIKSERNSTRSSEYHDDEFVVFFSITVVLVGVILVGVRGILRTLIRGENQPLVHDAVGDAGGIKSVDAVGETIHHAMRVFTAK